MGLLPDSVPQWAVQLVSAVIIMIATVAFTMKRKTSKRVYHGEKVDYTLDERSMETADIDYSELQRNLNEGVHALDNVRDNVQTLFSGVQGAQVLHSEVEHCVNSLADEIDLSSSSESTLIELEKLLENETRERWALAVSHSKELKAINSKCMALEDALNTCQDKFDFDLALQKESFESIIREKNDEMKAHEEINADQKRLLSDLQAQLNDNLLEITSLKSEYAEFKKSIEDAVRSFTKQAQFRSESHHEMEGLQSELLSDNGEMDTSLPDLSKEANSDSLEGLIRTKGNEILKLRSLNEQYEASCGEYERQITELKIQLERLQTVCDEREATISQHETQIQSELATVLSDADRLKVEFAVVSDEKKRFSKELHDLRLAYDKESSSDAFEISRLRALNETLQSQNSELEGQLQKLEYEVKTKLDDLAYKDAALKEALSQAEQFRNEQKMLTDKQLEISLIETDQRIRDIQLMHDRELSQLKASNIEAVNELNLKHHNIGQEIAEKRQEEVTALKLEVLEANNNIELLTEEVAQLNAELKEVKSALSAAENDYAELQSAHQSVCLNFEQQVAQLQDTVGSQGQDLNTARSQLLSIAQLQEQIAYLQAELDSAQGQNCILSNALLDESSKHKCALDELAASRRLSDVLKEQYEISRSEEEKVILSRIEEAVQQNVVEFENTISHLVEKYENQIAELEGNLSSYKNREEDAGQRESAFAETLRESLAAVNKSKDSEISLIHQEYKKKLAAKDAELDASRLDFQTKLSAANKALEQQAKSFEERLSDELNAQMVCFSKRLEFSENTICKLQEELQSCRTVINDLNAQVKISKFKADGAGVLLDRVHSYKSQLACSDQEKSELLYSLESERKDLNKLNEKVRNNELLIQEFEYIIRNYEIELKNRVEAMNLIQSSYSSKITQLEACLDRQTWERCDSVQNVANLDSEDDSSKQIEELQLSMESMKKQQAEFTSSMNALEVSYIEKIGAIEESFEKERGVILASRDDLSSTLMSKSKECEDLQAKLVEKQDQLDALSHALDHRGSEISHQFAEEREELNASHERALHVLKSEHERQISQLIEASNAEQSVMVEKAKTELAKEWQAIIESSEALFQEKLRTVVEATKSVMQNESESAIQTAIEHEKKLAQEQHQQHQAELKMLHEQNEKVLKEVNDSWQTKFDTQCVLIDSLQNKLEQLDRFHKPKAKVLRGEHDPLTGSKPGSVSTNSTTKRSKPGAKENTPNSNDTVRIGRSSDSTKTLSSRGSGNSRSRSRRDSLGYRYWKASDFQLRGELGQGTYGTYFLAVEHKTSTQYAICKISRRKIEKTNSADVLVKRIEMMGQLTHPYLRRMLGSFEDDRWIYIVQEFIPNSKPLSDHLQDLLLKKYVFPPSDVAFLTACLASALDYVHSQGMVHCQVAIHKVLLTANGIPKLAGPAIGIDNLPVPPPEYLVSERSIKWSPAIDSWSLGVLAFTLLVGRVPFSVNDDVVNLDLVATDSPKFSSHSDPLAKSLIEAMLCKDPSKRPSMSEVLLHPFIVYYQKKEPLSTIREDQQHL